MQRILTERDIPELKKIWKDIFHDSDNFINWFFSNRFRPQMSFAHEINGEIVCVIHSYPIKINLHGKALPAVMISGVATLPHYRKKGLMHSLFKFALNKLDEMGYFLCYYYPANPDFYKSLGHIHITDNITVNCLPSNPNKCKSETYDIKDTVMSLKQLYNAFSSKYNCGVNRQDDFELKMSEHIGEGLFCKCISNASGNPDAYVIYHQTDAFYEIAELAGNEEKLTELLSGFSMPVKAKLPPDFPAEKVFSEFHLSTGNMGGIINVRRFLSETASDCPLIVKITDSVLCDNCGVFDFKGNPSHKLPDITLTAGELLQTVTGYKVHPRLTDYFPTCICFSQDLY